MVKQLIASAFIVASIAGVAEAKETVVADFDQRTIEPAAEVITLQSDADVPDNKFLRYAAKGKSTKIINLPVPKDGAPAEFAALTARLRGGEAPDELRWFAVDAQRRVIFQKRFTLPAGQQWQAMRFDFSDWRWGNEFTGDWREVRAVVLRPESEHPQFDLDDVKLDGDVPKTERSIVKLAFPGKEWRMIEKDGLTVATDAEDLIPVGTQDRLHQRMLHVRAFLKRIMGDAYQPTQQPAFLLIFKDADGDDAFFKRLGERWAATITPPDQGGYTLQSIATSTWGGKLGPERPVYFHEGVHAVAACDLRLIPGTPLHNALQEGLASYLQLVLYPDSLDFRTFADQFAKPLQESRLFKPLPKLLTERVTSKEYAQLASLVGYLVEKDPALLAKWITAAADGKSPTEALKAAGTSVEELQDRWWKWGAAKYADPDLKAHFDTPAEFK